VPGEAARVSRRIRPCATSWTGCTWSPSPHQRAPSRNARTPPPARRTSSKRSGCPNQHGSSASPPPTDQPTAPRARPGPCSNTPQTHPRPRLRRSPHVSPATCANHLLKSGQDRDLRGLHPALTRHNDPILRRASASATGNASRGSPPRERVDRRVACKQIRLRRQRRRRPDGSN